MHGKLSRGLIYGLVGNLFFVLFSIVCYIYYKTFGIDGIVIKFIEVIAYVCEAAGFIFLLMSIINLCRTVRMRKLMKFGFSAYLLVELILMVLELNAFKFTFYNPYSLILAIFHSIFSAAVCFTFLSLDPGKTCLEIMVTVAVGIMLGGMFGNIFGIRIYFSILANALAYVILFASINRMLAREMIEIDCYGDKARVVEYKSTFF